MLIAMPKTKNINRNPGNQMKSKTIFNMADLVLSCKIRKTMVAQTAQTGAEMSVQPFGCPPDV